MPHLGRDPRCLDVDVHHVRGANTSLASLRLQCLLPERRVREMDCVDNKPESAAYGYGYLALSCK